MKAKSALTAAVSLIVTVATMPALSGWAGNTLSNPVPPATGTTEGSSPSQSSTGSAVPIHEDLGFDVDGAKTNKISSIYKVDPINVGVIYKGRSGSRPIPRQNLPPQLAAKYPFDAQKASEYQKQQADAAARQAELATEQAANRVSQQ